MAEYTFVVAEEFNYPNITIYKKLCDGVQTAWRMNANEGYVFYDVNANDVETQFNPETGLEEEVPVTYYYTVRSIPLNYNWNNFHWAAVPRDSVDENYIFGLDTDHEIM